MCRFYSTWLRFVGLGYGRMIDPLPNQVHTSQISTDPDLWHKRLEHPSCLQLASSLLPILSLKISFSFIIIVVFVPKLNRQVTLTFNHNKISFSILIYCIVTFGVLIKPQLILENVFSILDVLGYFLWITSLKPKHLLESFITFAQNQFQAIKTIRVDNGLEFISMRNFFLKKVLNVNARVCTLLNQM